MNDLQSELAAFYRDCEQRLAVCEAEDNKLFVIHKPIRDPFGYYREKAAGYTTLESAWRVTKEEGRKYVSGRPTDSDRVVLEPVAASRNQRPGEIRALVKLAKALEAMVYDPDGPEYPMCDNDGQGCGACASALANLLEILADWRNNQ